MEDPKRMYNTTLHSSLVKRLKLLAVETDRRQNDLLEEALQDLFEKYEKESE
jgi:predicted transcriptional regulator